MKAVDDSLTRSVRKLRAELAKGPRSDESRDEFLERVVSRFESVIRGAHFRQLEIFAGVRGRAGRPPTGPSRWKSRDGRGRKKRFSPDDEAAILRKLDAIKTAYTRGSLSALDREDAVSLAKGDALSDVGALKLLALRTYTERFRTLGLSQIDAREKARAEVRGRGPLLRTLQVHVSRMRSRAV